MKLKVLVSLLSLFIVPIALVSCTKNSLPPVLSSATGTPVNHNVPNSDDSLHSVTLKADTQRVHISLQSNNLLLYYDENVNLFLTKSGFDNTSAVHLLEDFSDTYLAGFHFTTVAAAGNITYDFVDDNLNNVILKTITDTVINGTASVKINVSRRFTFFKTYGSEQAAADTAKLIGSVPLQHIRFSAYTYYNQKNYPLKSIKAVLLFK